MIELSKLTNINELIRTKRKKSFRPFLDPEKKSSENLKDFFPPGGTAKLDPKESLRDVYWRQTGEIFSEDFSSVIFFLLEPQVIDDEVKLLLPSAAAAAAAR